MRLLLDEMFPAWIAESLRALGHDVIAASDRAELRGLPDHDLFDVAERQARAVVTENVRDFRLLARDAIATGRVHHGLVLTTNRRFSRANQSGLRALRDALAAFLAEEQIEQPPSNREVWL